MPEDAFDKIIQSLNKSEKRYIKLHFQNEKNEYYIALFTAYENKINHKLEDLKLPKDFPIHRLASIKNYLKSKIFTLLTRFHYKSNKKSEVLGKLQQIEVLFNKKLYQECTQLVRKLENIVKQYWLYNLWLELVVWQLRLMISYDYHGEFKMTLGELYKKENGILKAINQIHIYREIRYKILNVSQYNLIHQGIHRLLSEELHSTLFSPINDSYAYTQLEQYRTISLYYKYLQEYKIALVYAQKEMDLWLNNTKVIEDRVMTSKYINGYINYCKLLFLQEKYALCIDSLNYIKAKFVSKGSNNNQYRLLIQCYLLELDINLAQEAFHKENSTLIPIVQSFLSSQKLNKVIESLFLYKFAYTEFCLQNWAESLEYSNHIINAFQNKEGEDVIEFAKLLQILVHFEMENFTLVENLMLSSNFQIKEMILLLKTVKALIYSVSKKERLELLEQLKKRMFLLEEDQFFALKKQYFDFLRWINSQMVKLLK